MSASLLTISHLIQQYGYFFLLIIAVVEGPIISVMAGFLVHIGYLNFLLAYIAVVAGDIIGDVIYYMVGRFGSKHIFSRFKFFKKINDFDSKKHFEEHGGKTLVLGKITHSLGWVALMSAGVAEMNMWAFIWYNLLGTLPKSLFFLLIGYYGGAAFSTIEQNIQTTSYILFFLLSIILIAFIILKNKKKTKTQNSKDNLSI
jgi:membrane protein DedA with SNARE-associated domain